MAYCLKDFEEIDSLKDEIASCLLTADVSVLTEDMLRCGLVSQAEVSSLAPDTPLPQHFLSLLYRNLLERKPEGAGPSGLSKVCFELLTKHGVSSDLLDQLRHKYEGVVCHQQIGISPTASLAEARNNSVATSINSHMGCGAKRQCSEHLFTEHEVQALTVVLAEYSNKWKEIGISLNIPYCSIENILATMHFNSIERCLNKLLQEWVTGQHPHAKPPTLNNLKVALRSTTVRLGRVANTLEADLIKHGVHLGDEDTSNAKRPHLQAVPTSNVYWFSVNEPHILPRAPSAVVPGMHTTFPDRKANVGVIEERSMEVMETARLKRYQKVLTDVYSVQPEVPKDSWPPVHNEIYINLAVTKHGAAQNPKYARSTVQKGIDDIFRNKVSIEYKSLCSDLESGSRLLIEGRPGSGKTTLVHKVSRDWATGQLKLEHTQLLFLIRLRHFFSNPDITLLDLVNYYYSNQTTVDEIVKYAEKYSGEGLCFVLDGLDEYTPGEQIHNTTIFKLIEKQILPKAVVIVSSRPSGLAAVRNSATKQVETLGFLKNEIIEYVNSYRFSSPDSAEGLLSYLTQHPNIMHMCYLPIHAAIVCFLYDELGSTLPRTETEMYKHFTNYTLLRALCRDQPTSRFCLDSVQDLPDKEKSIFFQICELAFEKTKLSRHVMKSSEIKFFDKVSSDKDSLGLITVDHLAKIRGMENLYTFLHLTFQEYLAAYHIAHLEEEEQMKVIQKYCKKNNMQGVWKFFCGLVDFRNHVTKFNQLMKYAHSNLSRVHYAFESQQSCTCNSVVQSEGTSRLSYYRCSLNPTDFTAIGYVLSSSTYPIRELVLNNCEFGQEGIDAFLKEAGQKTSIIKTLCYHGGQQQFEAINGLLKKMPDLETLDITDTYLEPEEINDTVVLPKLRMLKISESQCNVLTLRSLSKMCGSNFQCVKLYPLDSPIQQSLLPLITEEFGYQVLIQSIGQFPYINLRGYKLGCNDMEILSAGIMERAQCTELILTDCSVGDEEAKVLSTALKCVAKLHTLNVRFNCIKDCGAKALAEGLHHCTSLKTLDLSCNEIGDEGAIAVIERVKMFTNLKCLIWNHKLTEYSFKIFRALENCTILYDTMEIRSGEIDVAVSNMERNPSNYKSLDALTVKMADNSVNLLGQALKYCTRLRSLLFEENRVSIDSSCANILVEGMQHCSRLQTLAFNCCSFSDGATILIKSLQSCNTLQALDFKEDYIGITGTKALAESLVHLGNLHTLKLDSNSVDDDSAVAIVESLRHCDSIKTLSLYNNYIEETGIQALAAGLKHHRSLESLNLGKNSFSTNSALLLAEGLKHCKQLHMLNLSTNYIGYDGAKALADSLLHCCNLQTLHLDWNQIGVNGAKAIAESLRHCSDLKVLNLDRNDIDVDGAKAIARSLKFCRNLQALHCDGNFISVDGALVLAESLKHCKNLRTLCLNENEIGVDGAKALAESLKHCSSLQILHLDNNDIGDNGSKAIAESLRHCNSLLALRLNGNEIGVDGIEAFADSLRHCKGLQTLHLDENFSRVNGAKALADCLKCCNNLLTLHLNGNFIGVEGAKALSESLKHCNNLRTLSLDWNEIGSDGIKAIAESLKRSNSLQTLHFDGNQIGVDGAEALAESLMHCTYLHNLHLDGNEVGEGARAIAESLKYCDYLHTLCLDYNDIGVSDAKVLGECLRHYSNLHTLHLNGNQIGACGSQALAENLQHCKNLHSLHLESNDIDDGGARILAETLTYCSSLRDLNLTGNELSKDGIQVVTKSLKHCNNLKF